MPKKHRIIYSYGLCRSFCMHLCFIQIAGQSKQDAPGDLWRRDETTEKTACAGVDRTRMRRRARSRRAGNRHLDETAGPGFHRAAEDDAGTDHLLHPGPGSRPRQGHGQTGTAGPEIPPLFRSREHGRDDHRFRPGERVRTRRRTARDEHGGKRRCPESDLGGRPDFRGQLPARPDSAHARRCIRQGRHRAGPHHFDPRASR